MCGMGLVCMTFDSVSTCRRWCKVNRGNIDCPDGQACQQIGYTVYLGDEVREIDAFGVCN